MRTCKICGKEKDDWEFSVWISKKTGGQCVRKICRECYNKDHRDVQLVHRYGITRAQWELILKSQDNKCKICGKVFDSKIYVDHDHKTMVIRGLLCQDCNFGLGKFGDNPETLRTAANYLETSNALKELQCPKPS